MKWERARIVGNTVEFEVCPDSQLCESRHEAGLDRLPHISASYGLGDTEEGLKTGPSRETRIENARREFKLLLLTSSIPSEEVLPEEGTVVGIETTP